jgi:hypothetical protein
MPRANRYFLLGLVWHITHRCHRKAFLLKFARDREQPIELCGFTEAKEFQRAHHQWIEQSLEGELTRAAHWSEAIAVGRPSFVEKVQNELGAKAMNTVQLKAKSKRRYCAKNVRLTVAILPVTNDAPRADIAK